MTKIFEYIYALSNLKILCFYIILIPSFASLLYGSLRKIFRHREMSVDKDLGKNLFSSSIAITTFLLTFALMHTLTTYQKVNASVYDEIAIMEQIDITLVTHDFEKAVAVRVKLKEYIQSIINQEWQYMQSTSGKMKTSKEFYNLYNIISYTSNSADSQQKELYQECFPLILDLSKARYLRQQFSGKSLPEIFWIGIFFLITISVMLFFFLDKNNEHYSFILLFPMASIGVLLALVVIFDKPFTGEKSVTTEAFQLFLNRMDERTYLDKV
jgi:Protein of unknown function (DUF4239)